MDVLNSIAAAISESDDSEFPSLFLELHNLLRTQHDEALFSEAWVLGLPHLLVDCMQLPLPEEHLHTYAILCTLVASLAESKTLPFAELPAVSGMLHLIKAFTIATQLDHDTKISDLHAIITAISQTTRFHPDQATNALSSHTTFEVLSDLIEHPPLECALIIFPCLTLLTRIAAPSPEIDPTILSDIIEISSARLAQTEHESLAEALGYLILAALSRRDDLLLRSMRAHVIQALQRWEQVASIRNALSILAAPAGPNKDVAARTIQAQWRGHRTRMQLARARRGIVALQRLVRRRRRERVAAARRDEAERLRAAHAEDAARQARLRAHEAELARVLAGPEDPQAHRNKAAIILQAVARGHLSRVRIARMTQARRTRAALLIQRVYRGHAVRAHTPTRLLRPAPSSCNVWELPAQSSIAPATRARLQAAIDAARRRHGGSVRQWSDLKPECEATLGALLRLRDEQRARQARTDRHVDDVRSLVTLLQGAPSLSVITPTYPLLRRAVPPRTAAEARAVHTVLMARENDIPLWRQYDDGLDPLRN